MCSPRHCPCRSSPVADPQLFSLTTAPQSSEEAARGQGPCMLWEQGAGCPGTSLTRRGASPGLGGMQPPSDMEGEGAWARMSGQHQMGPRPAAPFPSVRRRAISECSSQTRSSGGGVGCGADPVGRWPVGGHKGLRGALHGG